MAEKFPTPQERAMAWLLEATEIGGMSRTETALSFSGVRTPAFRPVVKRLYLCHAGRFWFSMYRLNVSSGAPPAVPA